MQTALGSMTTLFLRDSKVVRCPCSSFDSGDDSKARVHIPVKSAKIASRSDSKQPPIPIQTRHSVLRPL